MKIKNLFLIFICLGMFQSGRAQAAHFQEESALVPEELEKLVQLLDWHMTLQGERGRRLRNVAVTKLSCVGKQGVGERYRVIETAGRLLDHYNPIVVEAATRIGRNLNAVQEIQFWRKPFWIRNKVPLSSGQFQATLDTLIEKKYEGLEVIQEFYPDREDVYTLNQLADRFHERTGRVLKVKWRMFNLEQPTEYQKELMGQIKAIFIKDFHHFGRVGYDVECPIEP